MPRNFVAASVGALEISFGSASSSALAAPRVEPYVFGGASAVSDSGAKVRAGGGVELIGSNGLGAGAEAGWVGSDYGIGLISFSVSYRLPGRRRQAVEPFVLAGYSSSAFRGTPRPFINVGAGADLWLRGNFGMRVEARDHAGLTANWRNRHIVDARLGFIWGR